MGNWMKTIKREAEQDGGGARGWAHLLPQTRQKSTSTCKMTRTEQQLNAGRTQTSQNVKNLLT